MDVRGDGQISYDNGQSISEKNGVFMDGNGWIQNNIPEEKRSVIILRI